MLLLIMAPLLDCIDRTVAPGNWGALLRGEGELPALELIECVLFTAKLILLSYLTLC